MVVPENQEQEAHPKGISLSRLISSEFGSAEFVVRQQLDASATTIEIDGVPWTGDRHFIPRDKILNKWISVIGPERQWRLRYRES